MQRMNSSQISPEDMKLDDILCIWFLYAPQYLKRTVYRLEVMVSTCPRWGSALTYQAQIRFYQIFYTLTTSPWNVSIFMHKKEIFPLANHIT